MFFNESYNKGIEVQASETGLTPDLAGVYRMIAESTEEWYNLREKMMKAEHVSIVNEDAQLLAEATNSFFQKIGNFFKWLLAKIKELWNKFVSWLDQMTMNDKAFCDKYEKAMKSGSYTSTGFEIEARDWKTGNLGELLDFGNSQEIVEELLSHIEKTTGADDVDKLRDNYSGESFDEGVRKAFGDSISGKAADFREDMMKMFMNNGKNEKVTLKSVKASEYFALIRSSEENLKSAKKEKAAVEKMLTDAAKSFDSISKDIMDDSKSKADVEGGTHHTVSVGKTNFSTKDEKKEPLGEKGKAANAGNYKVGYETGSDENNPNYSKERSNKSEIASMCATGCRRVCNITSEAFGILIQAIRDRRSECRGIIARMATYKPKSDKKINDGYNFEAETSVLDRF